MASSSTVIAIDVEDIYVFDFAFFPAYVSWMNVLPLSLLELQGKNHGPMTARGLVVHQSHLALKQARHDVV